MSRIEFGGLSSLFWSTLAVTYASLATAQSDQGATGQPAGNRGALEEIVVTAERRAEPLQRVPITVNAFSSEQLESAGVTTTYQLPQVTPGLMIVPAAAAIQLYNRGIGLSSSGGNNENQTSLYVDDVYYSSAIGAVARLENAARVEVLSGPQGTLYGRNATAGLINIVTPEPQAEGQMKLRVGYESYQTYTGSFFATGGLTDQLKASVAGGIHYQNQGFGRNVTTHSEANVVRNGDVRTKLLWEPSSADHITLEGDVYLDRSDFGIDDQIFPGAVGINGETVPGNLYDVTWGRNLFHRMKTYGTSVRWLHNFDNGMLFKSVTAYRGTDMTMEGYDGDVTAAPVITATFGIHDKTWQQEFLLQGTWGRMDFTSGFFYFRDRNLYPLAITEFALAQATASRTESYSLFAQSDYHLTDRDTLTTGVRYTIDRVGASGYVRLGGALAAAIGDEHSTFKEPTWRLALKHQFNDALLVYGSYSRGYKSGLYAPGNAFAPPVKPEILDDYEIGIKSNWLDNHLQVNVGGFYYNYKDMQVGQLHTPVADFTNAGKAEIYGPEVNIVAAVPVAVGALQVRSDFEILHAKFKSFPNCTVLVSNAPLPGNTALEGDCAGNDLAYAPHFQMNVSPQYTVPMGTSGGKLGLSISFYHNGGYFYTVDNRLRQSAYDFVNADVSYTFPNDRTRVRLYANNLTDKRVRGFVQGDANSTNAVPQLPRIVGVEFQQSFE